MIAHRIIAPGPPCSQWHCGNVAVLSPAHQGGMVGGRAFAALRSLAFAGQSLRRTGAFGAPCMRATASRRRVDPAGPGSGRATHVSGFAGFPARHVRVLQSLTRRIFKASGSAASIDTTPTRSLKPMEN